ncbi:hypothetical protein ACFFGH_14815 [Lysobacter korlensis]|uniref:Uncharacterized protein n=1 Tax=Lysobacter korlensis TaxID=553636 RepID=A0ABV6RQ57_9GAMM
MQRIRQHQHFAIGLHALPRNSRVFVRPKDRLGPRQAAGPVIQTHDGDADLG